jgi:hypothetical protein
VVGRAPDHKYSWLILVLPCRFYLTGPPPLL